MESKVHPGYTAFKSKAPGPGRYTIQVDLADGNGRWCETWFALADIDGEGKISRVCLDHETDGADTCAPYSFNGAVPVAWKPCKGKRGEALGTQTDKTTDMGINTPAERNWKDGE